VLVKNSFGHFYGRWGLPPPKIFGLAVGKTEAEKLIYGVSIFAWLVVPLAAVIPEVLQLFDSAEKPLVVAILQKSRSVDCEALRQGGFRARASFSEGSDLCNASGRVARRRCARADAAK
jgi:hypothetical protein